MILTFFFQNLTLKIRFFNRFPPEKSRNLFNFHSSDSKSTTPSAQQQFQQQQQQQQKKQKRYRKTLSQQGTTRKEAFGGSQAMSESSEEGTAIICEFLFYFLAEKYKKFGKKSRKMTGK